MKILHAAYMLYSTSGVVNQMESERVAARTLGLNWDVEFRVPEDASFFHGRGVSAMFRKMKYKFNFFRELGMKESNYDVILLRHSICDVFQAWFLVTSSSKVFLVHHTLEDVELSLDSSILGKLKRFGERLFGFLSLRLASGVVGVTNEIIDFELRRRGEDCLSFLYPNGGGNDIDSSESITSLSRGLDLDPPEFIFVASTFVAWHGLDRLIASILLNEKRFVVHVVGNVFSADLDLARGDSRIIFHGLLNGHEIDEIMRQCVMGFSCFALERKGMAQACPLKVREYLAVGLPVYSGHADVFPEGFKFYHKGECDIDEILEYSRMVSSYSRSFIRFESKQYISKVAILSRLYRELVLNVSC